MRFKTSKRSVNVMAIAVIIIGLLLVGFVGYGVITLRPSSERAVESREQEAETLTQISKTGDVASVGVFVRIVSEDDQNTKVALATYCEDSGGNFIIDGTTSSKTAEITGKSTIGDTVTCYAFDSTHQTLEDTNTESNKMYFNRVIDAEAEHIVIDVYNVSVAAKPQFFNDVFQTGHVNVSAASNAEGTLQKFKLTNNNSNQWLPLGGFSFDKLEVGSNISKIDMTGTAILFGMDHGSTTVVKSSLISDVSSRENLWDFVFEVDDDSSKEGNQILLMEEHDYLEIGPVVVTADSSGCNPTPSDDIVGTYTWTKGYFRSSKDGIGYGHETDSDTAAVITADIGDKVAYNITGSFYCES